MESRESRVLASRSRQCGKMLLLVPMLLLANAARGDDAVVRYVASQGDDRGDCALPVRPCRTVQYALGQAGKGDEIRVASGAYALTDVRDTLQIAASAVGVRGGFDRFDHFIRQAPATNQTTLTGVPVAMRDALEARGFHVIVDRKGIDADARAALAGLAVTQVSRGQAPCTGNTAGKYPCDDIDLLYHLARGDLSSVPKSVADVWGFVDLNTEREYALLGVSNALAVIDVTDPTAPFEVGAVPGAVTSWRDVKVIQRYAAADDRWNAHAYVSAEGRGQLTVVDLTGLPNRVGLARRSHVSAHNVYASNVDYGTGVPLDEVRAPPLLHVLGSAQKPGAVQSFDAANPRKLKSVAELDAGYSHDASSMLVTGARTSVCTADTDVCEVLADFNEKEILLWDFSDQSAPARLSSTTYAGARYVHSGWWTEDGRYLLVHDELDEHQGGLNTTVRIFDLADLKNPTLVRVWSGPTRAIDHNGYARGNRYYMSTYTRGLTVLDITDPLDPSEVGFFDTHPASDSNYFGGAWGVYPFLPSGNVLISDMTGGLFVLGDRTRSSAHVRVGFTSSTFGGEEGDEVSVRVARRGKGGAVSVDYAVLVGSAGTTDFTASSGTLHWPVADGDGAVVRDIPVLISRDDLAEPVERAFVRLGNPQGGAVLGSVSLASVFIGDPGRGVSLGFAESRIDVHETAGRVFAIVKRLGSAEGNASVSYKTHPVTASEGTDYRAQAGKLTWADGDATARTIMVPLVRDDVDEPAERFEIRLASASGAVIANHGTATVEIGAGNRPPTFSEGASTKRSVKENRPAGSAIGPPVAATDPDGDALSYALAGTDAASFALGDGGQLQTSAALDYETKSAYAVTVTAEDGDGASAAIDVAIAVSDVNERPGAPTNLSATAKQGIGIELSWTAPEQVGDGIVGYRVQRRLDETGDRFRGIADTPDAGTAYVDADVGAGVTYRYRVRTLDGGRRSEASNVTRATAPGNRPPAFSDGASTARNVDENTIAGTAIGAPVTATDPDGDTPSYALGGADAASFALGSGGQLQTSAALDYETQSAYSVTVTAEDDDGASAAIEVAIALNDVNERPGAPTNLTATAKPGVGIELSWTAPAEVGDGIVGYRVQRRQPGTDFGSLGNTPDASTAYVDADVSAGVTYRYQVRTRDGDQRSKASNVAKATAPGDS